MGYPERAFLIMRETPQPDQLGMLAPERAKKTSLWENDHVHASLTSAGLFALACVTWLVGLRIAPTACVLFALLLIGTDLRIRIGKH